MKLAGLDLNLLVVFDALMAERSVTRAAKRLALSQPATSNALGRLRKTLGDPLFVSTARGMEPTGRALELGEIVRQALGRVEGELVLGATFDPGTAVRTFTILATDYGELAVIAPLMRELMASAPRIDIRVVRLGAELPLRDMEEGRVDLAVGLSRGSARGLYQQHLFHDRLTCVARDRHPVLRAPVTLTRFVRLSHVEVEPRGVPSGAFDAALGRRGAHRSIAIELPHYLVAARVVAGSDLVATVPARLVERLARVARVRPFEPPVSVAPFPVTQLWHARVHRDPGHRWLRNLVARSSG